MVPTLAKDWKAGMNLPRNFSNVIKLLPNGRISVKSRNPATQ
jgi:hypothetical protein